MRSLISLLLIFYFQTTFAQSGDRISNTKTAGQATQIGEPLTGLWGVTEVKVGDQARTPTARWFQLNSDSTALSGNGWLQHSQDEWKFDEITKEILFVSNGIPDEYGAFKTTLSRDQMTWERIEDNMRVIVSLRRIGEKPIAPWDEAVGVWKVYQAQGIDPETKAIKNHYSLDPTWYRIRWDRHFVKYDAEGKRTQFGVWHMDAHRPTLTLFDTGNDSKETWQYTFKNGQMIWEKENDDEILRLVFQKDFKIGN